MKITGEGSYTYLITLIRANSLIFKSITGMLTLIWVGGGGDFTAPQFVFPQ